MALAIVSGDRYRERVVPTVAMAKHLVDLDEETLHAAPAELGTATIKEPANRRSDKRRRLSSPFLASLVTPTTPWRR